MNNKNENNSENASDQNNKPVGEGISKKKQSKNRGKKRKRRGSESSNEYDDVLPENTLEMETNLHASAIKNNLDDISVRKILKKVVTNDHVLALVKLREEEEEQDSGPENSLQPKLTRAKVKELMRLSPKSATWNLENMELTPIKHIPVKTRPEVKALIAQELPEDEDDEEYEPAHDEVPSDDDQALESCSDLESQPRTPATPASQNTSSPQIVRDGPFKVPQEISTPSRRKLDLEEEATIALRTRSKLSLSSTSIEHIESTFVPPDDLPMPAVDDLWNQFLNECLNPASTSKHEDDDEADPEYNVAADPDAHDEDEEGLGNSIIKISKKELNDLVTELFNIMPEVAAEDDLAGNLASSVLTDNSQADVSTPRWDGKREPLSDDENRHTLVDKITFEKSSYTRISIGKSEKEDQLKEATTNVTETRTESTDKSSDKINREAAKPSEVNKSTARAVSMCIEEGAGADAGAGAGVREGAVPRAPPLLRRLRPAARTHTLTVEPTVEMLPEQTLILEQQIRQHVQLATSNYLQLYVHPVHWSMGPQYKEYLETLTKLVEKNPKSVVNVCNLKPALELMNTWEKSVSVNSSENAAMVEFILKETDRCRRRAANNNFYVGDFHETFKRVVANSTVFLYPYLLPAMPYRAESTRRGAYLRSEDELIAMGLDQFWKYVYDNPSIYKPRSNPHPRQRWGLAATVQLVVKHMFPWMPVRMLLGHINLIRKNGDKDNPICKFFAGGELTPVQHKLMPYNPSLTLYEQPEPEIPRLWVRYLAKTSKRFRNYIHRRTIVTGFAPNGVPIKMGQPVVETTKTPLPIDFTKEIISNRANLIHHPPKPHLADKFDVTIINAPSTEAPTIVAPNIHIPGNTTNQAGLNAQAQGIVTSVTAPVIPASNALVVTNIFKMVETSTGTFLVPINQVSTVNTNITPITTPIEVNSKSVSNSSSSVKVSPDHCKCCVLLRKICKYQTVITDYFKPKTSVKKSCYCKSVQYPRISNKLRLLVNNYRDKSICNKHSLQRMLDIRKGCTYEDEVTAMERNSDYFNDLAFVTSFQLRIITRTSIARKTYIKKQVNTLFSNFNIDSDDPVVLAQKLDKAFEVELVDMYKEFLAFLTAEQADRMDAFNDYFIRNCAEDLMRKVNEYVIDKEARTRILMRLHRLFYDNHATACEMCCSLLEVSDQCPKLAEYVFSLFPHRRDMRPKEPPPVVPLPTSQLENTTNSNDTHATMDYEADHSSKPKEPPPVVPLPTSQLENTTNSNDTHATMDYEADHSSNGEDSDSLVVDVPIENPQVETIQTVVKIENSSPVKRIESTEVIISKTESQDTDYESSAPMLIVFDDENVKPEAPEWKRDEDKLILEVLKEHLTPEERKDKTIIEILLEKNVFEMISESLTHKSLDEVKNRILYLLQLLVLSEN